MVLNLSGIPFHILGAAQVKALVPILVLHLGTFNKCLELERKEWGGGRVHIYQSIHASTQELYRAHIYKLTVQSYSLFYMQLATNEGLSNTG